MKRLASGGQHSDKENSGPAARRRPFLVLPLLQEPTTAMGPPHLQRPSTATLERPHLLDLSLLDKLDMSLVRKEFLCITNLCRLPVNVVQRHNTLTPVTPKRSRGPTPEKDKETSEDSLDDENSTRSRSTKVSKINKSSPKQQKKTISSNNNKHENGGTKSQVRPVKKDPVNSIERTRDQTDTNSTSPSTGTSTPKSCTSTSKSRLPQPCTTCGRPEQPERFHSHPPPAPKANGQAPPPTSPKKSQIAMKSSVQKPAPIRYKSKKQEGSATSNVSKVTNGPKNNQNQHHPQHHEHLQVQGHSKTQTNSLPETQQIKPETQTTVTENPPAAHKGPRTLTCYICAREFGTASLHLHEPKCLQRWERENAELPRHLQRKAPVKPSSETPLSPGHWNKLAWEASQANLAACQNCGRTFLPDRLLVHQRSCRPGVPRVNFPLVAQAMQPTSPPLSLSPGPPTVRCYICGRMFGTKSIGIHEPQCLKKWHLHNDQLPPSERLPPPARPSPTAPEPSPSPPTTSEATPGVSEPKKPTLACYICGREFGISSIYIHEPQCLRKWRAENARLPPDQRRPEPQRPDIKFTPSGGVDYIGTFHRIWENHLAELVPCRICGRRFFPDRIEKHEKACNNLPIKTKKK